VLNKLRLLLNSGELLDTIKSCCEDVQISGCWNHERLTTVHISASFKGNRLNAWGADKNESVAIAKSLVELVERIHIKVIPKSWKNLSSGEQLADTEVQRKWPILQSFLQTSSGMAAHFNKSEAYRNSLSEIIERHVITKAMIEGINAQAILHDTFLWKGPLNRHVALIRHDTGDGKYVYGTAASKSANEAINSAKREISALIPWSKNAANITQLLKSATSNQPSEIQAYHLTHSSQIGILDPSFIDESPVSIEVSSEDIWIADIQPHDSFKNLNLKITRAFSPLMQPLFFGRLSVGLINPAAIDFRRLNIQAEYNVVA
jgi:hypothetical protein